jgi:hypothetical protein
VELDLDKTEAVLVRPILFVLKDARSRPAVLIFDNANLDHLSSPFPDDDESEAINTGLEVFVPSSLLFRHEGEQTVFRLKDESAPALEMAFPSPLLKMLPSGGQILWIREGAERQHAYTPRRPRTRRVTLSAVLLQEVNAPAESRLVCPDETCADEFDDLMSPDKPAAPYYLIDAVRLVVKPRLNGVKFRILATDDRGRLFTFQGTVRPDFIKGSPLPTHRD